MASARGSICTAFGSPQKNKRWSAEVLVDVTGAPAQSHPRDPMKALSTRTSVPRQLSPSYSDTPPNLKAPARLIVLACWSCSRAALRYHGCSGHLRTRRIRFSQQPARTAELEWASCRSVLRFSPSQFDRSGVPTILRHQDSGYKLEAPGLKPQSCRQTVSFRSCHHLVGVGSSGGSHCSLLGIQPSRKKSDF